MICVHTEGWEALIWSMGCGQLSLGVQSPLSLWSGCPGSVWLECILSLCLTHFENWRIVFELTKNCRVKKGNGEGTEYEKIVLDLRLQHLPWIVWLNSVSVEFLPIKAGESTFFLPKSLTASYWPSCSVHWLSFSVRLFPVGKYFKWRRTDMREMFLFLLNGYFLKRN